MIDSLFDKKTAKNINEVAKKKAKVNVETTKKIEKINNEAAKRIKKVEDERNKKNEKINLEGKKLVEDFLSRYSAQTINQVIGVIKEFGHPGERDEIKNFENKYASNKLDVDDLIELDKLYKSNYMHFSDKGDIDG